MSSAHSLQHRVCYTKWNQLVLQHPPILFSFLHSSVCFSMAHALLQCNNTQSMFRQLQGHVWQLFEVDLTF